MESNTKKQPGVKGRWGEIGKLSIPILMFVAGYALSSLERSKSQQAEIDAIEQVVMKELASNYKILNVLVPPGDDKHLEPRTLAEFTRRLELHVYDTYLDRFGSLPAAQLEALYEAYSIIRFVVEDSERFVSLFDRGASTNYRSESDATQLRALATRLRVFADKAYEDTEAALRLFSGGDKIIELLAHQRGGAFIAYEMTKDIIDNNSEAQQESGH